MQDIARALEAHGEAAVVQQAMRWIAARQATTAAGRRQHDDVACVEKLLREEQLSLYPGEMGCFFRDPNTPFVPLYKMYLKKSNECMFDQVIFKICQYL